MSRFLTVLGWVAVLTVVCGEASGQRLLGSLETIDIKKDRDARRALDQAVQQHNLDSKDEYLSTVLKVLDARRQVVQGVRYTFTVIMAKTNCRNSVNEVCTIVPDPENAQTFKCKFTVWSRLWMNSIITHEDCNV